MAQLSDLQLQTRDRLGTEVTTYFNDDKITRSLNRSREQILLQYSLERFIKEDTISFVSGIGSYPIDYLRFVNKDVNKNGFYTEDRWYKKVSINRFDDNVSNSWTDKLGVPYIYSADTIDLTFRYFYIPTNMEDPSDDSEFDGFFDDAHTLLTASLLFFDLGNYQQAQALRNEANKELTRAVSREKLDTGEKHVLSSFGNATYGNDIIL